MPDAARTITKLDNRPPIEDFYRDLNADLPAYLATELASEIERTAALVENAAKVPTSIADDIEEAKATDIVSQMKKHHKILESRRMGINAGPRDAKAIIDGFIETKGTTPLEKGWERIEPGVTAYKRLKVEKARREAEERARLAREEEERQRAATAEAERKRREAEAAQRRAEQEQREAEERRRKAIEDERLAKERQRKAEQDAKEAQQRAIEAESKRAKAKAEREAKEAQERAEREAEERARARQAQEAARAAEAAAKTERGLAKADVSDANKEVKTATSLAKSAEGDVRKAEKAADAPAAKLSGAKGEYGGQSGLRTKWVGDIIDRNLLDKKELWPFLTDEALQMALDKFVSTHKGGRQLKGARIYTTDGTSFR